MPCMLSNLGFDMIRLRFHAVPVIELLLRNGKLLLVNDRQAKTFTTNSVDCNNCGVSVALVGEGDFNLTAWDAHKGQCTK